MSRIVALALVLLVVGCARQPLQPVEDWERHQAAAQRLNSWQLSGKLGARLPDNSGSARLRWHQDQSDYRIDLSGPFGQGRVIIETTESGVRLRQGGEPPLEAASAETLMWQTTGWRVPVAELTYWVRGIPAPDSRHRVLERTPQGLLKTLRQSGWTLHYSDYEAVGLLPLPGRIVAERKDTRLTLIVYDWSLPES
ncbi:lipoprotein insertase outer membrane protein LolB [Marinimicrobium sp. LS-A18]|uniref:lipoprotein insertase outer membrane protein LolB n=1 Tax=Marinimicrobium sp. LS-A18 TaxID=1381596 RepID=UPI000465F41B|nr:lipoprotein insertase outer membrane protein LolB [Marinimicrobium sp. LS-A18]